MTTYRSIVTDLDRSFKMDDRMGYKALILCTVLIVGQLVQSVQLSF